MADVPLVEMRHIQKYYGRVHALRDVNLTIRKGEIVGLLGDNGAGKSTLIKVLSGAVPYPSGEILIKGRKVDLRSTNDAISAGIETIYQDSALVSQLSIARNLFLGRELRTGPRFLDRLDQDPAVSSSIFVTMITDSMGFLIFLGLAVASGLVG